MPEYLDDPSVLTKDKLKSELLAHNVELPSGNPTKDVYVSLYLQNLTAQNITAVHNNTHMTADTLDAFSSDEELPPPVVYGRSRSSSRKATRKTDKVKPDELDVTVLTDDGLRAELQKHGVGAGPIVASTRKLYEKKLQKLLDDGPAEVVLTDIQVNHFGSTESDMYSDKEDEETAAPEAEPVADPEPVPEPVPIVERTLRSRGKTPLPSVTPSREHYTVEKIETGDQISKVEEEDVLKELFLNNTNSPTGIIATCRRPIKGAAGRPLKSSDLWKDESLFSPKRANNGSYSSYTESCPVSRVSSLPPRSSRPAAQRSMSWLVKLILLLVVAAFVFLVYQSMESNSISPFVEQDTQVASSTA